MFCLPSAQFRNVMGTLAAEMTFYLVAPCLVRKSVMTQAAFALASFALR